MTRNTLAFAVLIAVIVILLAMARHAIWTPEPPLLVDAALDKNSPGMCWPVPTDRTQPKRPIRERLEEA